MKLLQDWTTIVGSGTTSIVQSLAEWTDLAKLADVMFWLEVRSVTNPGSGNVELSYETSPTREGALFRALATSNVVVGTEPIVTKIRLADRPAVPLARWVRWKLRGTDSGAWSVTFRLFAGGGAAAGGFDPKSLPNLAFWCRSDLGVTLDGSGNVETWADQSGVGDPNQDLTQATSGQRPVYVASNTAFGGRPTLGTSTTSDEVRGLASGTWSTSLAQPATWYHVFRLPSSGATVVYLRLSPGGITSGCHSVYGSPSALYAGTTSLVSFTVSADDVHVLCVVYDGSSSAVYVDDASTPVNTGDVGSDACASLYTGTWPAEASRYEQAEILAYGASHDEATRRRVMRALGARYGVTVP